VSNYFCNFASIQQRRNRTAFTLAPYYEDGLAVLVDAIFTMPVVVNVM
jgi:hypothetical protein